jgi:hypothetical protein
MTRYLITSTTTGNEIDVTYDASGQAIAVLMNGTLTRDQHIKAWSSFPLFLEDMHNMVKQFKTLTIQEVMPDISFERFYKAYNLLLDRKRAEAIWNKMTDANKMKAIMCIAEYDKYLARTGVSKAYPKTFLLNEYFHTDYKKVK